MNAHCGAKPLVSVVIPCYNAERFIQQTIASVIKQTYPAIEIIVVDDGSTDGTADIIAQYHQIHYFSQPNAGPAVARNTGLQLAHGEYVAFLDADDIWLPEMLDACMAVFLANDGISAVHVNWLPIDQYGALMSASSGWQPWQGNIFQQLIVHIPFNSSSLVWRRACWEQIGGFDGTPEINDDWINWLRIAYRGHQFTAIDRPLVYRRSHVDAITQRQGGRVIRWRLNALNRLRQEFECSQNLWDRAFAEAYWIGANVALRDGRSEDAVLYLREAFQLNPALATSQATYFAIANGGRRMDKTVDLSLGIQNVRETLTRLFVSLNQPVSLRNQEKRIWSMAWFSLAHMAYAAEPANRGEARKLLARSLLTCPGLPLRDENLQWSLRFVMGRSMATRTKNWIHRTRKLARRWQLLTNLPWLGKILV